MSQTALYILDDSPDREFTGGARGDAPNPCDACLDGRPEHCTGVSCWRCPCGCQTRRHGVATHAPEGPQQGAPSTLRSERR